MASGPDLPSLVSTGRGAMPALGLGTFQLKGEACRAAVTHALEVGYRHIDTAQMYGNEADVGAAIQSAGIPRDEIFLTTKVWWQKLAPDDVLRTVDESLVKLKVDQVDLLLIHWPNPEIPVEETLATMMSLRDRGRTRLLGVSNFPSALLARASRIAGVDLFCNQVEYHPLLAQDVVLEACRERDMLLVAYSPLARGRILEEPAVRAIAAEKGCQPSQVVLRWLLDQEGVAAIPRASSAEHRLANWQAQAVTLTSEEHGRLTALARGERMIDPGFAPCWD